jgi:uncharacterized protein YfaS (alpha-2-macroglobulin family)
VEGRRAHEEPRGVRDARGRQARLRGLRPEGTAVGKGSLALNAFGSAWASFAAEATLPLGEYRITFFEPRRNDRRVVGSATLFRLEEYKLPEFEVKVAAGAEGKLYRLGDRVEATVEARTFYGAPVSGADAEVLVKQRPFWRNWIPQRDYPWLYETRPTTCASRGAARGRSSSARP